jgi:hypothetical protein
MFVGARLPFHQAPVLASPENSLSPMIPTLAHPSVNPNHSRTYVIPRGGGSPSSISHHSRITTYPPAKFFPCVSYVKTGGTPPGHTNSPRPNTSVPLPPQPPLLPLPPSPPFTSHSQSCYRPFTHPSPCLVTINPCQGTNSYTMPIAIRMPTVHFYRCDPPGEIRS